MKDTGNKLLDGLLTAVLVIGAVAWAAAALICPIALIKLCIRYLFF